ncbi:MAG: quinone-dependent dihydroorotate dehydrogenase [Alphaproteobacteria bacterium]
MKHHALARPFLRLLSPEAAHWLTIAGLAAGLGPRQSVPDDAILGSRVWGLDFANPVGLAAGFDKDAKVMAPLLALGFGFVEVGSLTPKPQKGNKRPRVFRLTEDEAIINRLGFNNAGIEAAAPRLARFRKEAAGRGVARGIVGVNLGKGRDAEDAAGDFAAGAAALAGHADYLVINVSSPNTPGLRALQGRAHLAGIIARARAALPPGPPPLLLKIAPDLASEDVADIAALALTGAVDGLIVANSTIARPAGLRSRHKAEAGGLSGRPLMAPSTALLGEVYRLTQGKVPLIGNGGIASGADAYAKIRAGASLVQLYTALVFQGPGLIARIKEELAELLRDDGFERLEEAVGADS